MADTNLLVLAREYKKLREEVKKVLSMPKGDKGDQGEKGEKGDTGDTGPQGFPGRDGKDGINGYDGKEGRDGVDGKDGKDGLDGVGVANAYIDFDNSLVIVLTDGREVNAGFLSQETKDNVVATFKQGAQTLNELLPVQTGNANKFLKTDGENVSWDTLDGSDIDLASPPVIGNTTPNAATFTTLTATGQTNLGTGLARSIVATGSASGSPGMYATGGSLVFSGGGSQGVSFFSNLFQQQQLNIAHTSSAVNFVQVTGAATGGGPTISMQGSDTNIGPNYISKGSGAHTFYQGTNGVAFQTRDGGSTYPYARGTSYGYGIFSVSGTTNGTVQLLASGTGNIVNTTSGGEQLRVSNTASAVNYVQVTGAATGSAPVVSAQGSDANIVMRVASKGTQVIAFSTNYSGSGTGNTQFTVSHTANSANNFNITGAAAGAAPTLSTAGSDTNIDLALTPKGTGNVRFGTYTANMALTVQGYIEIKDSGGTVRRLAVVA